MTLTVLVAGPPVPKERPRKGKRGRFYTPKRTRLYEQRVKGCALHAAVCAGWPRPAPSGPMRVEVLVVLPDKRRRDLDNLVKGCLDAMNGVAFCDDSQIVELVVMRELDRERPRVEMRVTALDRAHPAVSSFSSATP